MDQYLLDQIENDFKSFSDPMQPVIVSPEGIVWRYNNVERIVTLSRTSGSGLLPDICLDGVCHRYHDFLASEYMGSLSALAGNIVRLFAKDAEAYVIETSADHVERLDQPVSGSAVPATQVINELAQNSLPFGSTRLVLVSGLAGSGKTYTLKKIVHEQARLFLTGETKSLYLYIDAQGKTLSSLFDVLAKVLQDIGAMFRYSAVESLTRRGLLVPIIDGFDELLGSGGYDDAFASLALFISKLNGEGTVLASARSTFFDYKSFYDNAALVSDINSINYELELVKIQDWNPDQVTTYFERSLSADQLAKWIESQPNIAESDRNLLCKPFYAAKIVDSLKSNWTPVRNEDLLSTLVNGFIDREVDKLKDKNLPILSREGHIDILQNISEEMWAQQVNYIDQSSIRAIAELVSEKYRLSPSNGRAVVEKISSYAFLTTESPGSGRLRFEHEVFYGYFLGISLTRLLASSSTDLRIFMNKAPLDETTLDRISMSLGSDQSALYAWIANMNALSIDSYAYLNYRENFGSIVGAFISKGWVSKEAIELKYTYFKRQDWDRALVENISFVGVYFDEVFLRHATISNCSFKNCQLEHIYVTVAQTKFMNCSPEVVIQVKSLVVTDNDDYFPSGKLYDSNDIRRYFELVGLIPPQSNQPEPSGQVKKRIEILDKFLKKMEKRFRMGESEIAELSFAEDPEWKTLWKHLVNHGLIRHQIIAKSGKSEPLVRLTVLPEIIRKGQNVAGPIIHDGVASFWRDVLRD